MEDLIVPLGFMSAIAGFVTLGVVLNVFQKWAKHRLMSHDDDRVALMEARLAELEERVDFAERALTEPGSRRDVMLRAPDSSGVISGTHSRPE